MTGSTPVRHAVVDSPVGPLTLVERDDRLAGLYMADQRHLPEPVTFGSRDDAVLPQVREQLSAYFAGELQDFDLPLALAGTPFQQQVWTALREVPYGSTCTYGALAEAIGRPSAVRAVGAANGRNPVCIVVPCHRVVGSTGQLTGYAGGVDKKARLLALEHGATLF
jgi:methylated-DNA-[protein]-cysteine S-methyltransferase